ncbi:MAG TPA: hypothetical protein PKE40_15715 [Arachnia sp.]|nr:hypothetical protein [Arachnia sp.]HMT87788.1 hypothetical protein [Arachnia sp.]
MNTSSIDGASDVTWTSGECYNDRRKVGRTNRQASDRTIVAEH